MLLACGLLATAPAVAIAEKFMFPPVSKNTGSKPRVGRAHGTAPRTLRVKDVVVGTGRAAKAGDTVTVEYVGELYKTGKEFDASWDLGTPFQFDLAADQVIAGFDQGIPGMRVGGRRVIVIPPRLGYGSVGAPPEIPPNATLIFVVDLVEMQ